MREFGTAEGRARVTLTSFLDVDSHWQAILESLFRHNLVGLPTQVEADNFCVVALFSNRPDHGVVLGNANSRRKLVVLNTGDIHFDPCLPRR